MGGMGTGQVLPLLKAQGLEQSVGDLDRRQVQVAHPPPCGDTGLEDPAPALWLLVLIGWAM